MALARKYDQGFVMIIVGRGGSFKWEKQMLTRLRYLCPA
jgi:hypothetical protein